MDKKKRVSKRAVKKLWTLIGQIEERQHRPDVAHEVAMLLNTEKGKLISIHNRIEEMADEDGA